MVSPYWCLAVAAVGTFLSPQVVVFVVVIVCAAGCVLAGCTGGMISVLVVVGMEVLWWRASEG